MSGGRPRPIGAGIALMMLAVGLVRPDAGAAQAAAPAAVSGIYPERQVLDAFRAACGDLGDLDATERRTAAAGWAKVADAATTPLAALIGFSTSAAADFVRKAGGTMRPTALFERDVAGERLYVVLSGVTVEGRTVNGCRLYDVGETRRIAPATVTAWIGRAPVQTLDQPQLARTTWEPGMTGAQDSFELSHTASATAMIGVPQVAGIALKADQVRG